MKWESMRTNKKFLRNLRESFGVGNEFTNVDAYLLYAIDHARRGMRDFDDCWMRMNVRNNLCAAAYRGEFGLQRIGIGRYQFVGERDEYGNYREGIEL